MIQSQASDLITNVRASSTALIQAFNEYQAAQAAYNGLNAATELTDEQFIGENAGLTTVQLATGLSTMGGILAGLTPKNSNDLYAITLKTAP